VPSGHKESPALSSSSASYQCLPEELRIICGDLADHEDLRLPFVKATVLPGGRNSEQKVQKGPQKKKSWPKEFVAKFWLILPKSGRKGAAENFQKKFLIFSCDNHVYCTPRQY
jgi:hypothetical protein